MGGSGGGRHYAPRTDQQADSSIQSGRRATESADYEAAVSERLRDLLSDYNNRDVDTVNERLEQLNEIMADYLESSITLRFGGSVSKHTYVDGISDGDGDFFLKFYNGFSEIRLNFTHIPTIYIYWWRGAIIFFRCCQA